MEALQRLVRALSPRGEFIVVVAIAFGLFTFASVYELLSGNAGSAEVFRDSDADLLKIVIYELIVLGVLSALLYARGWTIEDMGLTPASTDLLHAIGLLFVTEFSTRLAFVVGAIFSNEILNWAQTSQTIEGAVSTPTIILLALINPAFEELFLCGYVITALKKRTSIWTAINVSVAIRLLYHLYQGPVSLVSILPFGLIFGYYFARTGRLWPLIGVHMVNNLFSLLPYLK